MVSTSTSQSDSAFIRFAAVHTKNVSALSQSVSLLITQLVVQTARRQLPLPLAARGLGLRVRGLRAGFVRITRIRRQMKREEHL